jgi:N-carbamoylputrescine amidase
VGSRADADLAPGSARRPLTALGIQTAPAGDDLGKNLHEAAELARSARVTNALVVFPELYARPFWCVGLSDPGYFAWAEPVTGATVSHAADLARELCSVVVAPFFERGEVAGEYYNSVAVIGPDGRLLPGRLPDGATTRVYRKNSISAYRWGDQVNDEKFYFRPGNGFAVFDTPLGRIGVLVCLDRWFPEAWRVLALRGAQVVCVVNASQGDVDELFVPSMRTCAAQNVLFAVAVNRVGAGTIGGRRVEFYGRSCVVDPAGTVLAQASGDTPEALAAQLDLNQVASVRLQRTMYRDRRPDLYGPVCEGPG